MTDDLRQRIVTEVRRVPIRLGPNALAMAQRGEPIILNMGEADDVARAALAAVQDAYVPPPPGSDRDALPAELRALIAPHMPEYVSTACQTALALDRASTIHPPSMITLMDWERRQHAACRLTRKQDMARCACDCHRPSAH